MKHFLFAIAVLLMCAASAAAQMSIGKESLKGLPAVRVIVEDFDSQMVDFGLNKSQLQQDVELRLRKAGIKVVPQDNEFAPFIDVAIAGAKVPRTNAAVYAVNVDLFQPVTLQRDPAMKLNAQTWSATLAVGYTISVSTVRNTLADAIDAFINDYLSQNTR